MRLALVTRRYPPLVGGAEKVLSYLAPALAAEGIDVTVLTARVAGTAEREGPAHGMTVVRLPTNRLRFLGTIQYMAALDGWFARNPVDLAYVSMLKHDAYVAVGAGRKRGFPVVLRPEGAGATGDLAWQKWGRFGQRIVRRCRGADAVVAISPAIRAELLADGFAPALIHDIPNGVPIPAEAWVSPPRERRGPLAVFVGRLAREKGLDVLLSAWPLVRQAEPAAQLLVVGEGPARPELQALIDRLGQRAAVEMPGAATDVTPLLRAADLFVLPSREEGMSVALLEAMALGVPVIATAIPGNLRVIRGGVHGRLVPADNATELARTILECWGDPAGARERAHAARRLVADEYSIETMARRHRELFERLVRPNSARRQ